MSNASAAADRSASLVDGFRREARLWLRDKGPFWAASAGGHLLALALFALLAGAIESPAPVGDAPEFEAVVDTELPEPELSRFEIGEASLEPTVLDTASLLELEPPQLALDEQFNDDSLTFEDSGGGFANPTSPLNTGGLGGFTMTAAGDNPALRGLGGIGAGRGNSNSAGSGGAGDGFGARGSGMRQALAGAFGGTKQADRAVAGTVNWLARHQNPDGSWSLHGFHQNCKDPSCRVGHAEGTVKSDAAATAMALLPFLAAGQTHESRGPYQKTIRDGLYWLATHQNPANGDLSAGGESQMYTHGLCAIVMCEAYGMTGDRRLGQSAQLAIKFIEAAQNEAGGWRYGATSTDSDTSVAGWQLMALKSGQMAGLNVNPKSLERAQGFLKTVARGEHGGLFAYEPTQGPTKVMTAVGLLCNQYTGMDRSDPAMVEGMTFLMANLPSAQSLESYYLYYATQVMHNLPGPEWDQWNREMRRVLIESQEKEGCASGSWNPEPDPWGKQGGRLMTTAISSLSLEVYYRYIPLYKINDPAASKMK
ncbi:MAG: terpene cyclase/mutase family protein [Planctomyces sp.]|nr:terpene cyclase/mutase family protein [Planctomyces sp.]